MDCKHDVNTENTMIVFDIFFPVGVWGHAPLENFCNLEALRLLLRLFWGQYDASRRPDDRVSDVCPLRRTTLVLDFRSFANHASHTLRR